MANRETESGRRNKPEREKSVPAGAAALAKGLTLLNLIADANQPMRFAQLLELSELPKPTFARILRTLTAFDLVRQRESDGAYLLGLRFLELSHRVWDKFDLAVAAIPEMEKLARELGETVGLCRLDRGEVWYLDERSGDGLGVRVEVGRRVPLFCTAAGKALLAFQDPSTLRRLIDAQSFERFTDKTITDPDMLNSDLILTCARGYSVSLEEHLAGVNSVGVSIAGPDGVPIGALCVLGPASRMDQSVVHLVGRELIASARRITGSAGAVAISSHPRPNRHGADIRPAITVRCVLPWGAQLGESPVWHIEEERLYWVDILEPAVFRFDPATGKNESCPINKLVSAVLPAEDGKLLIASQDGIEWLDFDTGALTAFVDPEADIDGNRLNDAKIGPGGAIWVGSMRLDASRPSGALYRVSPGGEISCKEYGVSVANGLGWSPDQETFYFVDTLPGRIYAYDSAPGSGELTNKRILATVSEDEGRPGGLAVDADGGVWCAIWDGWRVNRYHADGTLDHCIYLPFPRPTSLTFGGLDLDTLFVTSARTRLPASSLAEAPLSGGLFACRVDHKGTESTLFGVRSP